MVAGAGIMLVGVIFGVVIADVSNKRTSSKEAGVMVDEPNKFQIEMGLQRLREVERDPEWRGFVRDLDDALEAQIRIMPHVWQWFDYFNSPDKPLNPREFLYFWSSLSFEDDLTYKLYTPGELLGWE
jgi:hypothetical protein